MGFWRKTGKFLGTFVDVRVDRMASTDYIKESTQKTFRNIRHSFVPPPISYVETYDDALERLAISEDDLSKRMKEFKRLRAIFLFLALVMLSYTISVILKHVTVSSIVMGLSLTGFLLCYAFRFDFYLFSMERQKLGCDIQDWIQGRLRRK